MQKTRLQLVNRQKRNVSKDIKNKRTKTLTRHKDAKETRRNTQKTRVQRNKKQKQKDTKDTSRNTQNTLVKWYQKTHVQRHKVHMYTVQRHKRHLYNDTIDTCTKIQENDDTSWGDEDGIRW